MRRLGRYSALEEEDGEQHGIDLAPMLDFVLNLLIFFIITAAFSKELGLVLSRPPPSNQNKAQNDDSTLYIAVHQNGDISIDQRIVDPDAVRANVERFHAEKPQGPVIVVSDVKAPTGVVVKVMDEVRQGGVTNVSIAPATSQ
ncbi:MAG: biopolymer transporter ExbD [Sinobacteraceae bacterium]|nr:biopolymer transporter ExbD [Nevskiaceae bacterium]